MANDWITDSKDSKWLDKKDAPPKTDLKTLDDVDKERQLDSEKPPLEAPVAPVAPPPPLESIPYEKVATELESASKEVLEAFSKLEKAGVDLSKISIMVADTGDKSKGVLEKAKHFKGLVETKAKELKMLSEEIAAHKNTLPKESTPKI